MQALHPNVVRLWRLNGAVAAVFYGVFVAVGEYFLARELGNRWPLPTFVIAGAIFALVFLLGMVMPALQYAKWRYALRPDDVLITYGVIWRTRRCIPRQRIQHVDITSGPFQRWMGLVSLNLYTAGMMGTIGAIPGITEPQAERMREQLVGARAEGDG